MEFDAILRRVVNAAVRTMERLGLCWRRTNLNNLNILRNGWRYCKQGCTASATTDNFPEDDDSTNGDPKINQVHFANSYCRGDQHWLRRHLALQRFKQRSATANPAHSENWRLLAEELDRDLINQMRTRGQLQHLAHYHHRRNQPKIRKKWPHIRPSPESTHSLATISNFSSTSESKIRLMKIPSIMMNTKCVRILRV